MIDSIIALYILFLAITNTYDLLVITNRLRDKLTEIVEIELKESSEYEESILILFEERWLYLHRVYSNYSYHSPNL